MDSDIRIQLPTVDQSQCQIEVDDNGHVFMRNMSNSTPTLLNSKVLSNHLTPLSHGDLITIVDRQFRFEFPPGSKFFPQRGRSPKPKSPRTPVPKDTTPRKNTPNVKNPKRRSSAKPLSPLTDNVPAVSSLKSVKSPKSAKKSVTPKRQEATPTVSPASKSEVHLSFSPSSFYKSSQSPRKSTENINQISASPPSAKGKRSSSPKSPASRTNTGSPFPKGNASLRKSISDLRRRSVPVFEVEESSSPVIPVVTPVSSRKRKSNEFTQPSLKRKRVSFGPSLSPEHFDKNLPPKTPVKKGATPGRDDEARKSLLKRKSLSKYSPKTTNSPRSRKSVSPSSARGKNRSPTSLSGRSSPKAKSPAKIPKSTPKKTIQAKEEVLVQTPVLQKRASLSSAKRSPQSSGKKAGQKSRTPSPSERQATPVDSDKKSFSTPDLTAVGRKSRTTSPAKSAETPMVKGTPTPVKAVGRKSRTPSPTKKVATPTVKSTPTPAKAVGRKSRTHSPAKKVATPDVKSTPTSAKAVGRKSRTPSPAKKVATPAKKAETTVVKSTPTPKKVETPVVKGTLTPAKAIGRKSKTPSPTKKVATPTVKSTPTPAKKAETSMVKSTPTPVKVVGRKNRSPSPAKKVATPTVKSTPTPAKAVGRKSRTPSPTKKVATPIVKSTPTPAKAVGRKSRTPSPTKKVATPTPVKAVGRKSRTPPTKKVATPTPVKAVGRKRTPSPTKKVATPAVKGTPPPAKAVGEKSRTPSPNKKVATLAVKSTPTLAKAVGRRSRTPSPTKKVATPAVKSSRTPAKAIGRRTPSPSTKVETPLKTTPKAGIVENPQKSVSISNKGTSPRSVSFGAGPSSSAKKRLTPKSRPFVDTPRPNVSASKQMRSPKTFFDDSLFSSPSSKKTSAIKSPIETTPKSAKKSGGKRRSSKKLLEKITMFQSPGDKIIAPPQDINKVVALRAIHGVTPKLTLLQKSVLRKTPKSGRKGTVVSAKKVKTWCDIVKQGASSQVKTVVAVKPVKKVVKKPVKKSVPKIRKSMGKTPKTPRAQARALAPSTGHADSPATFLVGKKVTSKAKIKTPKALPRKGRKMSMSKARKSMGNTSFSGLQEMFMTPEAGANLNESALYADIPDTPNGPNGMFVSPLSGRKSNSPGNRKSSSVKPLSQRKSAGPSIPREKKIKRTPKGKIPSRKSDATHLAGVQRIFKTPQTMVRKSMVYVNTPALQELFSPAEGKSASQAKPRVSRKSTNLVGVRELLKDVKAPVETNLVGVKELFKASKSPKGVSPSGVKNLMKSPKAKSKAVTPTGLKRLLGSPKTKTAAPSPSGLDQLFKTPKGKSPVAPKPSTNAKSSRKTKTVPQPHETTPVPAKSPVQRGGRKRKANVSDLEASPKRTKISEPSPAKRRATRRGAAALPVSPEKTAQSTVKLAKRGRKASPVKSPPKKAKIVENVQSPSPVKPRTTRRGAAAAMKKSPVKKTVKAPAPVPEPVAVSPSPVKGKKTRGKSTKPSPSPAKARATRGRTVAATKKSPAKKARQAAKSIEKEAAPVISSPLKPRATRRGAVATSKKSPKKATKALTVSVKSKTAPVSPSPVKKTRGKAPKPSPAPSPIKPRATRWGPVSSSKKSPAKTVTEKGPAKVTETMELVSPVLAKTRKTRGNAKPVSPVKTATLVVSPIKKGWKAAPKLQPTVSPVKSASKRGGHSKKAVSPVKPVEGRKRKANEVDTADLLSPPTKRGRQAKVAPSPSSPKPKTVSTVKASRATRSKKASPVKITSPVKPATGKRGAAVALKANTAGSPKLKSTRGGKSSKKEAETAAQISAYVEVPHARRGRKNPVPSPKVSPVKAKGKKSSTKSKTVSPQKKAVTFKSPAKSVKKGTKVSPKSPVVARRSTRRR